jgi:hypothetical protein
MSRDQSTPSLVPEFDVTVHLVLNDFGSLGRSYLETDEDQADLETIIRNLVAGEYSNPKRIVAFNTAEGWARDVSEDVAWEVLKRVADKGAELPLPTHNFCVFHVGEHETLLAENAAL